MTIYSAFFYFSEPFFLNEKEQPLLETEQPLEFFQLCIEENLEEPNKAPYYDSFVEVRESLVIPSQDSDHQNVQAESTDFPTIVGINTSEVPFIEQPNGQGGMQNVSVGYSAPVSVKDMVLQKPLFTNDDLFFEIKKEVEMSISEPDHVDLDQNQEADYEQTFVPVTKEEKNSRLSQIVEKLEQLPNMESTRFLVQEWIPNKPQDTVLMMVARVFVASIMALGMKYSHELSAIFDFYFDKLLVSVIRMLAALKKAVTQPRKVKIKYRRRYVKERAALKKQCRKHHRKLLQIKTKIKQEIYQTKVEWQQLLQERMYHEREMNLVKEKMEQVTKDRSYLEKEVHLAQEKMDMTTQRRNGLEKKLHLIEEEIKHMTKDKTCSETKLQLTKEELAKVSKEMHDREKGLKDIKGNLKELTEECDQKQRQKDEAEDKAEMVTKQIELLKTKLDKSNGQNQYLEHQICEEKEIKRKLKERLSRLETNIKQAKKEEKSNSAKEKIQITRKKTGGLTSVKEDYVRHQRNQLNKDLKNTVESVNEAVQQINELKASQRQAEGEIKKFKELADKERRAQKQIKGHIAILKNEKKRAEAKDEKLKLLKTYSEKMMNIFIGTPID